MTTLATHGAVYGEEWGAGAARYFSLSLDFHEQEEHDVALMPIPGSFVCPMSMALMRDPVASVDGQVYERNQIEQWFRTCRQHNRPITSPLTGLELSSTFLMPLLALRKAIETYLQHRPELANTMESGRSYEEAARTLQDDLLQKEARRNSMQDEITRLRAVLLDVSKERDTAEIKCANLQDELDQMKAAIELHGDRGGRPSAIVESNEPQPDLAIGAPIRYPVAGGSTGEEGQNRSANQGVLRPSVKGTEAMKQLRDRDTLDLRAVYEVTDSDSAVTHIVFGQEHQHQNYILLVTAAKNRTVVIYRCYRKEMEIAMLGADAIWMDSTPPTDHERIIAVHCRLIGHGRSITACFFNLLEDQFVTASIDKSLKVWAVDSGEMLKVFTDSCRVSAAIFLQFAPQVVVAANSNADLKLVNIQNGTVLQKLRVETEVRALQFDDTGLHVFAGTKEGSIHTLGAAESNTLKLKHKLHVSRGGITCLTFVPAAHGRPAGLLVNSADSNVSIVDCTYDGNNQITELQVRHRVGNWHSLLSLKCCYSPSGQGYLISGSENKEVLIYSLARGSNYQMHCLKHHPVPVVAVAVNKQDTLLASADSLGRIVLWRRMDYSHLPD